MLWAHENPCLGAGMPARPGEPGPIRDEDRNLGVDGRERRQALTRTTRRLARARWCSWATRRVAIRRRCRRLRQPSPSRWHRRRPSTNGSKSCRRRTRHRSSEPDTVIQVRVQSEPQVAEPDHLLTFLDGEQVRGEPMCTSTRSRTSSRGAHQLVSVIARSEGQREDPQQVARFLHQAGRPRTRIHRSSGPR